MILANPRLQPTALRAAAESQPVRQTRHRNGLSDAVGFGQELIQRFRAANGLASSDGLELREDSHRTVVAIRAGDALRLAAHGGRPA